MEKFDRVFLPIAGSILAILLMAGTIITCVKLESNRSENTWQTTGKVISVGNSGIRFEWADRYGEMRVTRYTVADASDQFVIGDNVQLEIVYNRCSKVCI